MQKRNDVKVIAAANPDVFGDGTVVVSLDSKEKSVNVTLHEADLRNSDEQRYNPFSFVGDGEYKTLNIILSGSNTIWPLTDEYTTGAALSLTDCEANIYSMRSDTDEISIRNFRGAAIYLKNATLNIGNRERTAFEVTILSEKDAIVGENYNTAELNIYSAKVSIQSEDAQLTKDLTGLHLMYNQERSNCVVIEKNSFRDGCDGYEEGHHSEIKADKVTIYAPYPIFVGKEAITSGNNDFFRPSTLINSSNKDAHISYDPDKKVLIFDTVSLGTNVVIDVDDVKLMLHGYNSINNSTLYNGDHLVFCGKNALITGDPKASLTISGENSDGIVAAENLAITGFKGLDLYTVRQGFIGTTDSKSLTITVPTLITTTSSGAMLGFDTLIYHDGMVFYPARKYDCSGRRLVELENGMLAYSMNLKYEEYLEFLDTKVTALNMSDIKVPGASYDPKTKTLTLTNFDASGVSTPNNALKIADDMTIVLNGHNVLSSHNDVIVLDGDHNLTIEGPGSLSLTSSYDAGIYIPGDRKLTICKGASIEINSYDYGIFGDASTLRCEQLDPMDPHELVGNYSTLVINNASIHAKIDDNGEAAIAGFKIEMKDAAITAPVGAEIAFKCTDDGPLAGIVSADKYVAEVTITKNGALAIESIQRSEAGVQKIIRDGQLLIVREGKVYNAQGVEVK